MTDGSEEIADFLASFSTLAIRFMKDNLYLYLFIFGFLIALLIILLFFKVGWVEEDIRLLSKKTDNALIGIAKLWFSGQNESVKDSFLRWQNSEQMNRTLFSCIGGLRGIYADKNFLQVEYEKGIIQYDMDGGVFCIKDGFQRYCDEVC